MTSAPFQTGERVWVLDMHGRPMSPVEVEGKTPEGLIIVRFLEGPAGEVALRFPFRANLLVWQGPRGSQEVKDA